MATHTHASGPVYRTITGAQIPLSGLSEAERGFLDLVAKKYGPKQDWTRFAAWWNARFSASGLPTTSVAYRICQDLEARLGITQGKVAPPDYRDSLGELIDAQFGSRQEFCRATGVDPGQLSRVLANRDNLSMKVLMEVLEVLHARLVIQTEEDSRAQTSIDRAAAALANAVGSPTLPETPPPTPAVEPEESVSTSTVRQLIDEQLTPLREQMTRLEHELHAVGGR
jgi:transcriptional regulator with XRE-family HTH domain